MMITFSCRVKHIWCAGGYLQQDVHEKKLQQLFLIGIKDHAANQRFVFSLIV